MESDRAGMDLVHKLDKLGIKGAFLNLIESYLTDRKIRVKSGQICSLDYKLTLNVPQRTLLEPILFTRYIILLIDTRPIQIEPYPWPELFTKLCEINLQRCKYHIFNF